MITKFEEGYMEGWEDAKHEFTRRQGYCDICEKFKPNVTEFHTPYSVISVCDNCLNEGERDV